MGEAVMPREQSALASPVLINIESFSGPYALLDSMRDAGGRIIDFTYRAVNEAAVADYALPREQLIGSTLLSLDSLTGDGRIFEHLVRLVETGEPLMLQDFEYLQAPPDGLTLYFDIAATKVGDGVGIAWWDVTGRYQSQRAVAVSERETKSIIESLLDPLNVFEGVKDDNGRIVDVRVQRVNEASCRYLGRSREQLEGRLLRASSHGEGVDILFAWCRHVLTTGEPIVLDEVPLTLPNGVQRRFDVRAVRVRDAVSVTYRDVTSRVESAREIDEAKERYRLVAENASEMVFQTGMNGLVEWASPSVQWALGWPPDQVIGKRFSDFIHPDDLAAAVSAQQQVMATGVREGRVEVRMLTALGDYRWMGVLGKAIVDADGTILGGIDAVRDIQTNKDAQAALMQSEERFRRAMDDAAIGMAIVSASGQYLRVNAALGQILRRTEQELLNASWQDLTHPEDLDGDQALADEVLHGKRDTYRIDKRYVSADGEVIWADLSVSCVRDEHGTILYYLSQIIDITERITAREALATSEEHFRLIAENSLDVVFRASPKGEMLWISPSVTEVFGWRPEDVLGTSILSFAWRPDLPQEATDAATPLRVEFEGRVRQADGSYRWVDVTSRPVLSDTGEVVSRIGRLRDIEAKKRAEDALRRSEQRFRTAMESAPTGMAVVNLQREFVEVNPALCRLLDRSEDWLLRHGIADVVDELGSATDLEMRTHVLSGDSTSVTGDHEMIRSDGQRIVVEHSVGLLRDPAGNPSGYVSQFADVTESRRTRDRLSFLATHDSLTALLNRRELVSRVERILGQTMRSGEQVGILFIDLDHLKLINDTYGHQAGDEVIVTAARRIRNLLRMDDLVARFGGDEFVVVLPGVHDHGDVTRLSELLHKAVSQPIEIEGLPITTSFSVGAVVVPTGADPDVALRQADQALYEAKRRGRSRTVLFGSGD